MTGLQSKPRSNRMNNHCRRCENLTPIMANTALTRCKRAKMVFKNTAHFRENRKNHGKIRAVYIKVKGKR